MPRCRAAGKRGAQAFGSVPRVTAGLSPAAAAGDHQLLSVATGKRTLA
jgi:hypothetical protein